MEHLREVLRALEAEVEGARVEHDACVVECEVAKQKVVEAWKRLCSLRNAIAALETVLSLTTPKGGAQ